MLIRLFVLVVLLGTSAGALETRVIDGDTLEVGGKKVRLYGMRASEFLQKCSAKIGGLWSCGNEAYQFLIELIGDRPVTCMPKGIDRYDRRISVY